MFKRVSIVAVPVLVVVLTVGASVAFAGKPTPKPTPPRPTLARRVAALEAQVAALTRTVNTLNTHVTKLQGTVSGQATEIAALKANPVLTLSWLPSYLSLDTHSMNGVAGPNIIFQGANVHVRSAAAEDDTSGLGNLIVGWNNSPADALSGYRSGSNNLVCGDENSFTKFGGFVAGLQNTVGWRWCSVSGG